MGQREREKKVRATVAGAGGDRNAEGTRVLFVTRDTVVHAFHGAITAIHNLLEVLRDNGMEVTVLVTTAGSRSPRLLFREAVPLPHGVTLRVPGFWRVGPWWVRPFAGRGWARLLVRAASRVPGATRVVCAGLRALGLDVFDRAWDLTEPTAGERAMVRRELMRLRPSAVVANYAFWGPLLRELRERRTEAGDAEPRTLILMHDLLAEHVRLFQQRGLPLDCNFISPEMEAAWLDSADAVIAIQEHEAAAVRQQVRAEVLVQPIRMQAQAASAEPEPKRVLFVGSNSPPNVQGLRWMVDEVWPLVLREEPDAVLTAAGSVCDRVGSAGAGVELLGHVASLEAEHHRAAVCVVPLLVGSGLKIKLLDALRFGKAAVSTGIGVQGVERWVANAVAVADEPAAFAAEVVRLLRSPELRQEREAAAMAMVQQHFGAGNEAERKLLQCLGGPG